VLNHKINQVNKRLVQFLPRDKSFFELSETNNPNAIPNLMMVGETG
jgi:hypothetical protein